MEIVLLLLLIAVLAVVGAFGLGALAVGRNAKKQLQVVDGVKSKAPVNWVGAHSPEAKLHRRMVAAVSELRQASQLDPGLAPALASLEQEAILLDEELVAAADLSGPAKDRVLDELESSVAALESVVDRMADGTESGEVGQGSEASAGARGRLERQIADFDDRLEAIRQAREELDELDPPGTTTEG